MHTASQVQEEHVGALVSWPQRMPVEPGLHAVASQLCMNCQLRRVECLYSYAPGECYRRAGLASTLHLVKPELQSCAASQLFFLVPELENEIINCLGRCQSSKKASRVKVLTRLRDSAQ